ncbi:MAG: hypothetical protein VX951_00090 [Planctomycetota bacterium]|nr:hypothetical protein [Planctomycetota bacterium]
MTRNRFFALLIGLGFAWRLIVSARMVVPREDGVNYLWMAERFAEGQVTAALSEVFSPLLALVIALPVAMGMEPFFAGQLMLALAGAVVVLPIAAISERLAPGSERSAALLTFVAARLAMLGAEVYTEPLFVLIGSYAFLFGLRQRYWWCGVMSGLAFWVRPEAALIPLVFVGRGRSTWMPVFVAGLMTLVLAAWRGACGHGFDPVPKLAFIAAHNVAGDTDALGFALRSAWHLLEIPANFLSAYGALGVFAILGLFYTRPRPAVRLLVLAVAVICLYVPRWRFLVDWMFVVVPLAAVGVRCLPKPGFWIGVAILHNLFWSMTGGINPNRIAELQVAAYLRQHMEPGQRVAGDMTRVLYFVGQRPLAPRHFDAEELIAAGRGAEFVVLRKRRATTAPVLDGLSDHQPVQLPDKLQVLATDRGMLVLQRR